MPFSNDHMACSSFLSHEVSVLAKVDGTVRGTTCAEPSRHREEGKVMFSP